MQKKLPVFKLEIDDTKSFVDAIALVEYPAIEVDFIAFSNEPELKQYKFDDSKMELLGPALIPEQRIYRNDNGKEYHVFFSKETVRQIAQSFFKRGNQSQLNIEHTDKDADSYVFQSMIVDRTKGIAPMDLPDGAWVVGVKVLNADIWKDIKEGKRKGFSIEGIFEMIPSAFKSLETPIINIKEDEGEELIAMLQQIQHLIKQKI